MMQPVDDPLSFLKGFFGNGNAIRWDRYESSAPADPVRSSLEPWVQRFQKRQSPFLLPRVAPDSKQTTWYVLCNDSREARSMRETLLAFIGPTYAKFNGELANLEDTDAIDQLCTRHFGSLIFRLPITATSDRANVNKLLETLMAHRDRESSRTLAAVRPIGRLLRDLEMAILAGNEDSAWKVYADIRSRGRLSATNLAFLQIRIFGSFENWTEILSMPNLNDLLQVRRPKRVSEQIAKAVYYQFILKYEEANDVLAAIETYRSVGVRYQMLVRSTEGFQSSDAIKFALIAAVAAEPPCRDVAEQLAQNPVFEHASTWSRALVDTLPTASMLTAVAEAITVYDEADIQYNQNNFDEAFALYLAQTPNFRSVCRVLETAVEVDTRTSAEMAIEYLASAPEDVRSKVLGRRVCTNQIELLTNTQGKNLIGQPRPLSSLNDWFRCIGDELGLDNAIQALDYGIHDWATGTTFAPNETANQLKQTRTGRPAELVRNAVPTFIRAFLVDMTASRDCKPIYNALIELIIYDDNVGPDDLAAIERLAEAILTTAPSHESGNNDYIFASDIALFLWDAVAAPRHFDWALSMLDLLIDTGAQQHTNLVPILSAITNSSRAWARRVSEEQWTLLELLAGDLGVPEIVTAVRPVPDEGAQTGNSGIGGLLAGKSIAIYSLTERIARRFGQMAEQMFMGIKLHFVHDKALTDRMKSLAKTADIFIVNTWDAKHAATIGIKANRPKDAITLEPDGKSASSLLRLLENFVCSQ